MDLRRPQLDFKGAPRNGQPLASGANSGSHSRAARTRRTRAKHPASQGKSDVEQQSVPYQRGPFSDSRCLPDWGFFLQYLTTLPERPRCPSVTPTFFRRKPQVRAFLGSACGFEIRRARVSNLRRLKSPVAADACAGQTATEQTRAQGRARRRAACDQRDHTLR